MRWLLPFALGFALAGSFMAIQKAYSREGGFVAFMEAHFHVQPGVTKVWPDCGCTVRYVGTSVHGNRYSVTIDKLD
jgi:hypothetical protein